MKSRNQILWILGVVIISLSCQKDIGDTSEKICNNPYSSHSKSAVYQAVLDEYVSIGFPGISLYVADAEGVWVGSSGFADISNGVHFEPCHVSKAASITKLLVGALTFKLQEEGVLDLDDKVSDYIEPSILNKIEHPEGMTLRNLMNHTTGIFDVITSSSFYLAVINNPNKDWEPEELLKYVYGQPTYELTNEYPAKYSNTNTLLLTMCIAKATGRPHAALLREKIFDPLGMNDTYYQSREELPEITAQGYFDLHNNGQLTNVSNFITGSGNGYGGVFSTVFDLAKFSNALFVDQTLLKPESWEEMIADFYPWYFVDPTGSLSALGAGIQRKFTHVPYSGIGHSGKDLGYSADLFYFPEPKMTMIFFTNYGTDADSYLKPHFFDFETEIMNIMFSN